MKQITNLINIKSLITELAKAKQLDKKVITTAVEKAFSSIINKKFKGAIKVETLYLPESDSFRFLQVRKVVAKNTSSPFEISLTEAVSLDDQVSVGDEIGTDVPENSPELVFTRNDIINLRQIIMSVIMNESKQELAKEYSSKIGKLMSGTVKQVHDHVLIIDLGKAEAKLPVSNLIPNISNSKDRNHEVSRERFHVNDRIIAVLESVSASAGGAELVLSRVSNEFALQVLEREVSELEDGTIVVEKIVRVPGRKTKVILSSDQLNEKQVMHTMLGEGGYRVQNISNQLNTENINFIVQGSYRETLERMLRPVEATKMVVTEKSVIVVIDDSDVGKFLGTKNHNALMNGALLEKNFLMLTRSNMKDINNKLQTFLVEKGLADLEAVQIVSSLSVFRSIKGIHQKMKIEEDLAAKYYDLIQEFLTANKISYDANINSSLALWKKKDGGSQMTAQQIREELKIR